MTHWLLVVLLVMCAAVALYGVVRRGDLYAYPTLCALTVLGWVAPQLALLVEFDELPAGALDLTMTMIVLSMAAILWGWRRGARGHGSVTHHDFDAGRLLVGAAALSLFGAFFRLMIRTVPPELLAMSQWSGPQTIYLFFAGTQGLALALAWLIYLRTGRQLALAIVVFNLAFYVDAIFIGFRRGVMIEIGFILLAGLWLARRWVPPRAALVSAALAAALLFNAIGDYRIAARVQVREGAGNAFVVAWQAIRQIDPIETLQKLDRREPQMLELYNTVHVIGATQARLDFTHFGNYWDNFVFRYVPGQLVGFDLKQSMMFKTTDPMLEVYGIESHTGTTRTGFADGFRAFWFFGAFVFFGFAWLMRICWERGMQGQLLFQFLYLALMKDALHAITHSTSWFVVSWPFMAIFAAPVFWFAARGGLSTPTPTSPTAPSDRPPNAKAPLFTPPRSFPVAR